MKITPLARLDDLPIPTDVKPTRFWPGQLRELAAHIGPYHALLLCDVLGGQDIYVPMDEERNRLADVIGPEKARIMSRIYGRTRFQVPVARSACNEARRGPVLAAVRAGTLTIADAAAILRLKRSYLSQLINHSDEGLDDRAWVPLNAPKRDTRQLDMFESSTQS